MIGQVVGQYKILEKLGEGGMGAVYKGFDIMVEREVAIKMLRPEIARQPELVERFRAEAVTLAKLNSPGIATLYNFFRQGEDFFMVMEFVQGRTLDSVLRESGAMAWERAVPLFIKMLECVQPAHAAGILHRDIKPANIMLTPWGGVKVMDFGIARVLGSARMTREGRMVGTIEYISPERIKGSEADIRADIYSLGVVLYEMLSGRLPFESQSEFEIMRGHMQEPPPPFARWMRNVPVQVEQIVMKSLAKQPEERYQTCSEFIDALHEAERVLMPGSATDPNRILPAAFASAPTAIDMAGMKPTVVANDLSSGMTGAGLAFAPAPPVSNPNLKPTVMASSPVAGQPVAAKPETPAGLMAKLNWKHYAAAGGIAAILLLVAMFAFRGSGGSHPSPAQQEDASHQPPVVAAPAPVVPTPASTATDAQPAKDSIPLNPDALAKTPAAASPALNPEAQAGSDEKAKAAQAAAALRAREAARKRREALDALNK